LADWWAETKWASYISHQAVAQNGSGGPKCHPNPSKRLIPLTLSTCLLKKSIGGGVVLRRRRRLDPVTTAAVQPSRPGTATTCRPSTAATAAISPWH